jgi:hypothetical protein
METGFRYSVRVEYERDARSSGAVEAEGPPVSHLPEGVARTVIDSHVGSWCDVAMADLPTREELYAKVDAQYHEHFPEAPYKLDATSAEHETWRQYWLEIRDATLNEEVNRVYWERYPDGPLKIDPDDPDHKQYVDGWLEIRDAIMDSAPLPPIEDADEPVGDDSARDQIRTGIYQSAGTLIDFAPDEFRVAIEANAAAAVEIVVAAESEGKLPVGGTEFVGAEAEYSTSDSPPVTMTITPRAHRGSDGRIQASLSYDLSGPGYEDWEG